MNFDDFLNIVSQLKTTKLGGQEAQFKLAPAMRLRYDAQKINAQNPKKAAVLALVYPNEANLATLLLTERASYAGTHSAQISFPGGKIEPNDQNLMETALRETYEEIGVYQKQIEIVRELTDVYIPPSNFLATPFLGYASERPEFITNHEVASTLEVGISDLLNEDNIDRIDMTTSYMQKVPVPCFVFDNKVVWGATGMMLSELKELIKAVTF